ncbi:MAG: helix-turn-helix domain-containing protein [Gemmatimonadaceae bacterium]
MTVGDCIKTLRASAGLKQRELAARARVSASMLSLVESGKREPTIPMLRAIAEALQIPANVLFAAALGTGAPANTSEARQARALTERLLHVAQRFLLAERFREIDPDNCQSADTADNE